MEAGPSVAMPHPPRGVTSPSQVPFRLLGQDLHYAKKMSTKCFTALLSKTGFSRKGRKETKFAKLFFAFFSSLRPLREGFSAKVGRACFTCA